MRKMAKSLVVSVKGRTFANVFTQPIKLSRIMKRILTAMLLLAFFVGMKAQNEGPELEYVVELKVKCEGAYQVGQTSHGNRVVSPIVGCTV